jgi:dihydroxyacetone kinase phosphoprotein-dependent L subunit
MEQIDKADLIQLINSIAEEMIAARDTLNTLDGAIGDGDLGITMTLGFQAIQKQLSSSQFEDMQAVLSECGMAFADNAASTFGALMATMFISAGKVIKGRLTIGSNETAEIFNAAAEGVQKRGKANLGEKTILDALIPSAEAITDSARDGRSLEICLESALRAAQNGAKQTIDMRSKAGRAGWLGDRTIGAIDPGAAAFVMMLDGVFGFVKSH